MEISKRLLHKGQKKNKRVCANEYNVSSANFKSNYKFFDLMRGLWTTHFRL